MSTADDTVIRNSVLQSSVAFSSDDVWVAGYTSRVRPLLAHWDGRSWEQYPVEGLKGEQGEFVRLAATGSDDIWVVGKLTVDANSSSYVTAHWDGNSWSTVAGPSLGLSSELNDVTALTKQSAWAVGNYYDETQHTMLPMILR